jgi:hypothetical protein
MSVALPPSLFSLGWDLMGKRPAPETVLEVGCDRPLHERLQWRRVGCVGGPPLARGQNTESLLVPAPPPLSFRQQAALKQQQMMMEQLASLKRTRGNHVSGAPLPAHAPANLQVRFREFWRAPTFRV